MTGDGEPVVAPWREIHDDARAVGAALQAKGLVPGDHVAILGPTSRELMTVIRGCWMAGHRLDGPAAADADGFARRVHREHTRPRIRHGDAKLVLIDDLLADFYIAAAGDPPIAPMRSVMPGRAERADRRCARDCPPPDPERLVILQYTSGSTSEPKGVMIPDRVLCANIDAAARRPCSTDRRRDGVVAAALPRHGPRRASWRCPMTKGVDLVQAAPQDFLAHPGNWMQWLSDYGGTATAGPNFSWVLATRALKRMTDLDLSRLTLALSGAEPVDPARGRGVRRRGRTIRVRPGGVFPAFGMAEVAIAGIVPPPRPGLAHRRRSTARVLETQRVAKPVEVTTSTTSTCQRPRAAAARQGRCPAWR